MLPLSAKIESQANLKALKTASTSNVQFLSKPREQLKKGCSIRTVDFFSSVEHNLKHFKRAWLAHFAGSSERVLLLPLFCAKPYDYV